MWSRFTLSMLLAWSTACGQPHAGRVLQRIERSSSPARLDATSSADEPALWAAAYRAHGGTFPLPAAFTGSDPVDRVLEGVSVHVARVSWDIDVENDSASGRFDAELAGEVSARVLARRIAAEASTTLEDEGDLLVLEELNVSFSLEDDVWTFNREVPVSSDVARHHARKLWNSLAATRVFRDLITTVGAPLACVTVEAYGATGAMGLMWTGAREGRIESDPVLAFARRAGLRAERHPPDPGTTIATEASFEGHGPHGRLLSFSIDPTLVRDEITLIMEVSEGDSE